MKTKLGTLILIAVGVALVAVWLISWRVRVAPPVEEVAGERRFLVQGRVESVGEGGQTLVVEHEEIPGFMPAMVMMFQVRNPEEVRDLSPGDAVAFDFVVTDEDSWIINLRRVDPASLNLPAAPAGADL